MKKLLFAFVALVALSLTACNDKDNNPFDGTSWENTTHVPGFTMTLTFENLTCHLSSTPQDAVGITYGANYRYTHSDNTASLTPINETTVSQTAVISGSTLTLTNLTSGDVMTLTKK